ncbi:hypothetical protein LUZ63_009020 [Rhynchospora breviuscula]|uniref:DUF7731 domain-containing protein n=1 Tax=Rhynchospora breviuscula TaxID=2022672 RepID=A0A9Q0HN64_9POAL|nr:hypothetical protein LUZ63_009020 [Rhynchospora breviuscula]
MALSLSLRKWRFLLALLCLLIALCNSDPLDVVGEAEQCFDDGRVYTCCQDEYRLSITGILNIPPHAANNFCEGPCLEETQLVLSCVEDELNTFRFQDGAAVADVRYALQRGCSNSDKRGDFNVGEPHEPDDYSDYYDHADMLTSPIYLLIFLTCCLLLLGY